MTQGPRSLEDKIQQSGGPLSMLRSAPLGHYRFPVLPPAYTSWMDEQRAWRESAILYDQSFHMFEVYIKGPDMLRVLSDITANNVSTFGKNRGKQLIACNYDGQLIGDAILFGLDDDECVAVGAPLALDWVRFQAEHGNYDVDITRDDAVGFNPTGRRRLFRYQLQGPSALQIVEKASGGTMPSIKFFHIGEFSIAGQPVRALNHTMIGLSGAEKTGLEIYGPAEYRDEVKDALLAAGAEFDLKLGGAQSYSTTGLASGWLGLPLPAIYTGEQMRPYRQWLGADTPEANMSLGGSLDSDNIDDYYVTPWDVGYGRVLKLDRDFIGAQALRAAAKRPHRQKVWLVWNDDDVTQAWSRSLFADPPTKSLTLPDPAYSTFQYDAVLQNDTVIGASSRIGYTRDVGKVSSLAMIDQDKVHDGAGVTVIWGEPNGGSARPGVERGHVQIPIRATVSTVYPA